MGIPTAILFKRRLSSTNSHYQCWDLEDFLTDGRPADEIAEYLCRET